SAIDFYCSVDKIQGADGKDRVVVTFDGKYLPYTEQVCYFFGGFFCSDKPMMLSLHSWVY
uniref:Cyanate lyase C-terminal domain-containing protein n=1 Tax=Aegilops tauschii subsp. strangulata TaxID=200361 RepID=A0A452YDI3_AEGTS